MKKTLPQTRPLPNTSEEENIGGMCAIHTLLNYLKGDIRQFAELVLEGNSKEGQQSPACVLNRGEQLSLSGGGILSLSDTTNHYSPNFSLSAPRKRSLLLTWQSKHKTLLSTIASRSSKYCCELSPRQIIHEETASVCCLITASCLRKHSEMSWTASEKDRICLLHQIETLSGYQPGYVCQPWHTDQMLHEREIQKFCSQKAVKNLQMQRYRSTPHLLQWAFQLHHANFTIILNQISSITSTHWVFALNFSSRCNNANGWFY